MRIIVHFGIHKTGTTSIQRSFYKSRLNLNNIIYPDFSNPNHGHLFYAPDHNILSQLKKNLALASKRDIDFLLSGEGFTNYRFDVLKNLYSILTDYSDKIIAVGYIRPPKEFIESSFQENLKNGNVSYIAKNFFQYRKRLKKFDHIFGKQNVFFWKFEPMFFPNRCVVKDFCQRLNLDILSHLDIVRINESMSRDAASCLYTYLTIGKEIGLLQEKISRGELSILVKKLSTLQGEKLRFSSTLISPILEKNWNQIKWMENRMGFSLAEDIYKHDAIAINSEKDLLTFNLKILRWLAEQFGGDYINSRFLEISAQKITNWIHVLRIQQKK